MGELAAMIEQRIAEASESLRTARAEGDAFLADAREAEIDDLRRIATENGIDPERGVDPVRSTEPERSIDPDRV